MPTISQYIPVGDQEYYDKWQAIEDKKEWLYSHLQSDVTREIVFDASSQSPNVPRPPEISVYRWNQHLKDSGFEVTE